MKNLALGSRLSAVGALLLALCGYCAKSTSPASRPPTPTHVLRVCADPNNLPYSNEKQQGFENEIASLIARDLNARVAYTWFPQRRGFVRQTLRHGDCDVIIGIPSNFDQALAGAGFAVVLKKRNQLAGA